MTTAAPSILSLFLAKGIGTRTISDIVDGLSSQHLFASDLTIEEVISEFHLRPELRDNLLAVQGAAEELAERLEREKVQILIRGIDPYPKKLVATLGKNSPPVLFAKGNLALLDRMAVGFCGSRHASDKGIRVASDSAEMLAQQSVDVVSGYAKGVDLAAHSHALAAGGTTTIVLAEGILHFRPKQEVKKLLNKDNYLVVSEFSPRLTWSAHNAMQRNSTIIGLSNAMIVIESGTTGGTHACASTALGLKHPVFVVEYAAPAESAGGNKQFLDQGANALRGDQNGRPVLTKVFEVLGLHTNHLNGKQPGKNDDPLATPARSSSPPVTTPAPAPTAQTNDMKAQAMPKRLIEVDLPIARISAHARREKSIRHGHISTLHIWWARRPLAACRAVMCAALWPDPADSNCAQSFRDAAGKHLVAFAQRVNPLGLTQEKAQLHATLSPESEARWKVFAKNDPPIDPTDPAHQNVLRFALLDFIADFANWDNSTVPAYLETSRALTQAAHEALGGEKGTRPLVVDPFAGGGSIPLEALRVGADAFASDLNPVAVLLNKVVLEYIPKYGQKLADEVRNWGAWIKEQAEKELGEFYPKDTDGATPIAYLWARTIRCEGAGCGAEVPLMRSLWLAKKANKSIALKIVPNPEEKRIDFEIIEKATGKEVGVGTVKRGSATCPCCGFTTPVKSVREQLKKRRGGAADARLLCVLTTKPNNQGRCYRLPTERDLEAVRKAAEELEKRKKAHDGPLSLVPDEEFDVRGIRRVQVPNYGMKKIADLFTPRQLQTLSVLCCLVREAGKKLNDIHKDGFANALQTLLACVLDKGVDNWSTVSTWMPRETIRNTFARQAIPITLDFAEANLFSDIHNSWDECTEWVASFCAAESANASLPGHIENASAATHPLPTDSVQAMVTDPPYYDAITYSYLSDYFYVWLRRALHDTLPALFSGKAVPKDDEIIVDPPHESSHTHKDIAFYERELTKAFGEGRRIVRPDGIGIIVFASKTTASWEAILQAVLNGGWIITGSWPIDTEREARVSAQGQARLGSSVHLVGRPREHPDGTLITDRIGDWRDVLSELPQRMHEWMPRLASEGVVGADAIFACLGPALEIFSRYSRVEKANGDPVLLKEYLEHVWAAVSKEALSTIFRDADATGLEPDARLTAMWLWTLGGGTEPTNGKADEDEDEVDEDEDTPKAAKVAGFTLEFDAARKIAQGLGIHLEKSETIVEVKGERARLLPVAERTKHLFGKDAEAGTGTKKKPKKPVQRSLFEDLEEAEETEGGWKDLKGPPPGTTVLDRLHQAMILFGAQRGELLKRFLVEDGVGKDGRFWKLAQSLAALYPPGSDERRWVEGVLGRKKGLGL